MREAALTIASGRDDFAPSLAARLVATLRDRLVDRSPRPLARAGAERWSGERRTAP